MNKKYITLDTNTNQVCPIFGKSLEIIPKPRTASIREREDDSPRIIKLFLKGLTKIVRR